MPIGFWTFWPVLDVPSLCIPDTSGCPILWTAWSTRSETCGCHSDRRHARAGVIWVQSTIIPRAMLIVPPNQSRTCRRHYAQVAGAGGTTRSGWPPSIATATARADARLRGPCPSGRANTSYAATDTRVTAAPCVAIPPRPATRLQVQVRSSKARSRPRFYRGSGDPPAHMTRPWEPVLARPR
jgi:hypothetical protein